MIGIAVNVLAVVIGGLIGSGLGSRIPEAFMEKIKLAFSVCAVGMGVASIVMMKNMPAVILSVVVGTVLGFDFRAGCADPPGRHGLAAAGCAGHSPAAEKRPLGRGL